jgi:TolA-binding protein
MRYEYMTIVLIALGTTFGCAPEPSAEPPSTPPEQKATTEPGDDPVTEKPDVTAADVRRILDEAAGTIQEYTRQKTDEAIQAANASYDQAKQGVAQLKARTDELRGETRERYREAIEELEAEMAQAEQRLEQYREASGDAWTAAGEELSKAMENVKAAYEQVEEVFAQRESGNGE